jgi:DNA mismatch repair protein MutS2
MNVTLEMSRLEEEKQKAIRLRREIEELNQKTKERERQIEAEREKAIEKARAEANEIITRTRQETSALIDEIREYAKHIESSGAAFELNSVHSDINRKLNDLENNAASSGETVQSVPTVPERQLVVGDRIFLKKMGVNGVVLSSPDEEGMLNAQAGILKVKVKLSDVRLADDAKKQAPKPSSGVTVTAATVKDAIALNRLDLRGMAADEAIQELSLFVDSAARQHMPAATIIHGKGTGKLRETVKEYLKANKLVKSFRLGTFGEGDNGVTIVEF